MPMRAVRIHATGGPQVLAVEEVPRPRAGPGLVLVRNRAIGVGMPDVMVRRGTYPWMPQLPAILGIESAGVVEEVGPGVQDVQPGDPVYVNARDLPERSGGYAEYRLAPAAAVHRLPAHCDLVRAAGLGNYQVAEGLLRMAPGFPPPRRIAVYGAAGGVGSAAVQLARSRGLEVIAIAGSAAKCDFARRQGASATIDHSRQDPVQAIADVTAGEGVDLLLDVASGALLPRLFEALAPFGIVVSYGFTTGEPAAETVPAMRRRFGRSPGWRLFSMHSLDDRPDLRRTLTREVIDAFARGAIDPQVDRTLPLERARDAHELFERKALLGKLVLLP